MTQVLKIKMKFYGSKPAGKTFHLVIKQSSFELDGYEPECPLVSSVKNRLAKGNKKAIQVPQLNGICLEAIRIRKQRTISD